MLSMLIARWDIFIRHVSDIWALSLRFVVECLEKIAKVSRVTTTILAKICLTSFYVQLLPSLQLNLVSTLELPTTVDLQLRAPVCPRTLSSLCRRPFLPAFDASSRVWCCQNCRGQVSERTAKSFRFVGVQGLDRPNHHVSAWGAIFCLLVDSWFTKAFNGDLPCQQNFAW